MKRRIFLASAVAGITGCLDRSIDTRSDIEEPQTSTWDRTGNSTTDAGSSKADDPPDGPGSAAEIRTFDDFDDLSRWTVLEGSMDPANRRHSDPSTVAELRAGLADERVTISRTLSDPVDCSEVIPGLTVATEQSILPTIQLFDRDGNRADFRRSVRGDRRWMRYPFGLTAVDGTPDLAAITEIRIALWVGDESRMLGVDELFFSPRPSTGTVTIQFDDGYATDYTEAFPILDTYEYPAVSFVNPVTIGSGGRLDLAQCRRLQDAGWTIANHTYSHRRLEELGADEQAEEIIGAKEWLLDHGFDRGARYFAYPFGQWDERTLEIVEEHHDLAFWAGRGVTGDIVNPLLCPRVGEPTAKTATDLLDRAARWGGHVTLFYHELAGQQRTDFERAIEHLHALESAGRLDVVRPSDLENDLGA